MFKMSMLSRPSVNEMSVDEAIGIVDAYDAWRTEEGDSLPHPGWDNLASAARVLADEVTLRKERW